MALQELEESEVCPAEIAEGKPGTVIIDNGDFKDDDLTGGTTTHRTNMMFVQPMKWINEGDFQEPSLKVNAREELKHIIPEEIKIQPYSTLKRGEPPPFKVIDTTPDTTETMKKMMVTHALVRLKTAGNDIVPEEQRVGAFIGFMLSVSPRQDQSKPYYFATLPKPPSKAVVYSLMEKAEARLKGMPFIQFLMKFTMIITCRLALITCFKILNVKKLWILIKSDPKSHLLGHAKAQVFTILKF